MPEGIEKKMDKQEAVHIIMLKKQIALQGGSVSGEDNAFDELVKKVSLGELSPEDGVSESEKIEMNRQDYH